MTGNFQKPTRLEGLTLLFTALFAALTLLWFFHGGGAGEEVTLVACQNPGTPGQEAAAVDAPAMLPGEVLDLNSASPGDLTRLPGIGEVRAADIVAWREANGPFQTKEAVQNVAGIGPGIYARIEPYITAAPLGEKGADNGTHLGG